MLQEANFPSISNEKGFQEIKPELNGRLLRTRDFFFFGLPQGGVGG